ncbi:protein spire homolog 2-like isoform X2 [Lethenteron reissneri]|uniref:protein spire homolog 2-like isoform X2 n=1 Tax=Lethenteron reissneri TaxID=7753 RepID=UPI002AB70A84|nr:protein spire homolog 2-like isoform X2 [Lethenteron reissneri]
MCETPGGLATRGEELQLSEAFVLLQRPATEDEAYALAYFACRSLARGSRPTPPPAGGSPPVSSESGSSGGGDDVRFVLQARGGLRVECGDGSAWIDFGTERALRRVGVAIYRHLDWGVRDDEERELSPALERLIEGMTCGASGYGHPSHASDGAGVRGSLHSSGEGGGGAKTMMHTGAAHSLPANGGAEEKLPAKGHGTARHHVPRDGSTYTSSQVVAVCVARVRSPDNPEGHYSSVLHSLYLHAMDKRRVATGTQNLQRLGASDTVDIACRGPGGVWQQNTRDRAWASVMEELGDGVHLRKVEVGGRVTAGPAAFRLTPFEMLLRDIALRRCLNGAVGQGSALTSRPWTTSGRDPHSNRLGRGASRPPALVSRAPGRSSWRTSSRAPA